MNDTSRPKNPPKTTAKKSRGRPFQPGNTMGKGRPKGSRNKTSALVKNLLAEHAEQFTAKLIQLGNKGNLGALKLAFGILCSNPSEEPITWTMPPVENAGDLVPTYSALLEATTSGELTARQAQEIKSILDSMLIAFKNKMGPPVKHIINVRFVDPPSRGPEESRSSAATVDTSEGAA